MRYLSRFLICLVYSVMLVSAAMVAGCSSAQAPVQAAGTPVTPAAGTNAVLIKGFAFSPATVTISSGTAIIWTNQDGATHTIVSDTGAPEAFSSDPLGQNGVFRFTFTRPGTYNYHCSIHPSMKGTVIVTA
jgi:plastocyanin